MGETNFPLVAHVGYDIYPLSRVKLKILIELSWVEKYRNPRVTEGESIYIYINVWKSSQRMNLRDVGSETSVNDTVQTNTNDK